MKALPRIHDPNTPFALRVLDEVRCRLGSFLLDPFVPIGLLGGLVFVLFSMLAYGMLAEQNDLFGGRLPSITQTVFVVSTWILHYWGWVLLGAVVAGAIVGRRFNARPRRWHVIRWLWPIALFSYILIMGLIIIARYALFFYIPKLIR
jgi:type II secretory pathway component PulF